jgi:hypothetical protein
MANDADRKWMLMPATCCVLLAAIGVFAYVFNQTPEDTNTVGFLEPVSTGSGPSR